MFDAIVVGLGAMGSAAAAHLARRGRRVLGLDRFTPPHALGASHGGSRIIRCAYYEGPDYVPLAQRAWEQWERLEQYAGQPLLTPTGGITFGPAGCPTVEGVRKSAQAWDLPHELLDAAEVARRWPIFVPRPGTVALYEERAGFVRPEAGVAAHLRSAAALGATIHTDEPVLRWEAASTDDRVVVETSAGSYEAEALILAAGPWAPGVLGLPHLPLEVDRQVQFWFAPPSAGLARHPVFIGELEDGTVVYGVPAHDDDGVKVGIHYEGPPCSPDTIERTVHPEEVAAMTHHLGVLMPSLHELLDARTCMYTNTPDRHFVIGRHPDHPRVALAAGFSGHGFKFAPVVGEILADLATEGATPLPIGLFDPGRFGAQQ